MKNKIVIPEIKNCARCGKNHKKVSIKRFRMPPDDTEYTHWGVCPVSKDPILISVTEK